MPNGNRRFIYSAKAVGVGANFGGTTGLHQFWASRALPIIGGIDPPRTEGPFAHPVLSFRLAETELSGGETAPGSGIHQTVVRATIEGLNILSGGITADRVSVEVTWRCYLNTPNRDRAIAITGANDTQNPFVNLRINGALVTDANTPAVQQIILDAPDVLPPAVPPPNATSPLADQAARDYALFRGQLPVQRPGSHIRKGPRAAGPGTPPPPAPLHFHEGYTHLVRLPNPLIGVGDPPAGFGVYTGTLPPGVSRIYLCEWFAQPDRQCLTAMRVILSAPNNGEIVICDPDPNGADVP